MSKTKPTLQDKLRAWAKGMLPMMAAVDFLIDCNQLSGAYVHVEGDTAWYDFNQLDEDLTAGRLNFLSGGEQATLKLAISLRYGEIENNFWRLDPERREAFIRALTNHQS